MSILRAAVVATAIALGTMAAGQAAAQAASGEMRSQLKSGLVVVQPEPALSDGRLVMRIVAFNQTAAPVDLRASDVRITTAGGETVALTPLAQLVRETRIAAGAEPEDLSVYGAGVGAPTAFGTNVVTGQTSVDNFTGGNGMAATAVASAASTRRGKPLSVEAQQALDAQVAGLKTAILETTQIAPRTAAGGQVVTEKLRFKSSDRRGLKVAVTFAGEVHEFVLKAP